LRPEQARTPVGVLSGGERARLTLGFARFPAGGEWIRTFGSAILIMLRITGVSELSKELNGFPAYRTFVKASGR
jgi:hypothetical protein